MYCECGCGQETPTWTVNNAGKGWVRGAHRRWMPGHFARTRKGPTAPRWRGDLPTFICQCGCGDPIPPMGWHRQFRSRGEPKYIPGHEPPARLGTGRAIPPEVTARTGYCECGCGERTAIGRQRAPGRGIWYGYPKRFVVGHAGRGKRGAESSRWKGGRRLNTRGHVIVFRPEHPLADRHGFVAEHRLVMEQMLGRLPRWFGPAHPDSEVVHHLNHDKTDNRPANLVVMSLKEHHALHVLPAATATKRRRRGDDTAKPRTARC